MAGDVGHQALAVDTDDLEREAARGGNFVGMDVAGRRRQARHDGVGARRGEHTLAQFGRQIVVDDQLAREQAVGLGVGVADRVAVALEGAARGGGHLLDDAGDQLRLVSVDDLDVGSEK